MLRKIFYLLMLFFIFWPDSSQVVFGECSDGWRVTGYYVPNEIDFEGDQRKIVIKGREERMVNSAFLDVVKIEGSGKTEDDKILEWYLDAWHISDIPHDYFGNKLVVGTVAVDPKIIALYSKLRIPTLQEPFASMIFSATDIGPAIKNRHIDVFVGSGEEALKLAWLFPENNTVCLEDRQTTEIARRLAGKILIATEENGEAWYVNPVNMQRYYLGRPLDAFKLMSQLGIGVKKEFIEKYEIFPEKVLGKILISVDDFGRAYYINPVDKKAYYLSRPADAFKLMRELGAGITSLDLEKIEIGELN